MKRYKPPYYAFISYCGSDEKWAKWLHKKLEYCHIPSELCKEHPNLPKKIRPVFWYKQDLSGTKLRKSLHSELNESKYLIVICSPQKDGERYTIEHILKKLPGQIEQSLKEDTYSRISEDMINDFLKYQKEMEEMLGASLEIRRKNKHEKTSVMISYRNRYSEEVEKFKSIITGTDIQSKKERHRLGCDGDYELKVLPPASLCGADEAHTPMRRWMLVGLLENHIREIDEVWVYESRNGKGEIDYTKSWWTIAEMIMVANINYDNTKKIKVKVYNPIKKQFYETTPQQYLVNITEAQHKRLARYLSNTRPDTMGPECLAKVKQLKMIANLMRHSTEDMKQQILENL